MVGAAADGLAGQGALGPGGAEAHAEQGAMAAAAYTRLSASSPASGLVSALGLKLAPIPEGQLKQRRQQQMQQQQQQQLMG